MLFIVSHRRSDCNNKCAMKLQDTFIKQHSGSIRYVLSALLFVTFSMLCAMRISMSVAITVMVNSTSPGMIPSANESCRNPSSSHSELPATSTGEFNWDEKDQAMIIYSFYVGYLLAQMLGGYLAEEYSVTWILSLSAGWTSLLTCLTAVMARTSFQALIGLRVLQGIGEGLVFPCIYVFIARWIPLEEQGFLTNVIASGSSMGAVIAMSLGSLLCKTALGWPSAFITFGGVGIVCSISWLVFAADNPEGHQWISKQECAYIVEHRPPSASGKLRSFPWKKIFFSPAVLLLGLETFGGSLNFYIILTELPSYLYYMFGLDVVHNGLINSAMSLGCAVALILSGKISDKILDKKLVSKNVVRKTAVCLSCFFPSFCMLLIPLVRCNYYLVLTIIFINTFCLGFSGAGDVLIGLDIAPKYAGLIMGIVNFMGNLAGVAAPFIVGALTEHHNTLKQWNLVFVCTSAITIVGALMFILFGTSDEQDWAKDDTDENYRLADCLN